LFIPALFAWERTYGGSERDVANCIAATSDSGFVVVGHSYSFGAGDADVYLLRIDSNGDTLWTRTYGGLLHDTGESVVQTPDGGLVIVGRSNEYSLDSHYYSNRALIIRTNSNGDTLWTRRFESTMYSFKFSSVLVSDSCYIVSGSSDYYVGGDNNQWRLYFEDDGDTLWTRKYPAYEYEGSGYPIKPTDDGGYIITGSNHNFPPTLLLRRLDSSYEIVWERFYGVPGGTPHEMLSIGYDVIQTKDGGFLGVGTGNLEAFDPCDVFVVRTDSLGDTLWTNKFGNGAFNAGNSVVETPDDGFLIAGCCNAFLAKLNADGDTMWTRFYGDSLESSASSIAAIPGGGYIIAGSKVPAPGEQFDVYIFAVDSLGNDLASIEEEPSIPFSYIIDVYPNPFNSSCRICAPSGSKIEIFDINGRLVARIYIEGSESAEPLSTFASGACRWQPDESLGSGVYLVRVRQDEKTSVRRVVYLK